MSGGAGREEALLWEGDPSKVSKEPLGQVGRGQVAPDDVSPGGESRAGVRAAVSVLLM